MFLRHLAARFAFALTLSLTPLTMAHDFWVEPSALETTIGSRVDIALKVGHANDLTELPRNPARFREFFLVSSAGRQDVVGVDGATPAGILRVQTAGPHIIAYVGQPNRTELDGEKFTSYLKEEGLEWVIAAREAEGRMGEKAVESYSRCAKAIVEVEGTSDANPLDVTVPLGLAVELVPDSPPSTWQSGSSVSFRLLRDGKPLADALVRATAVDQFEVQRSARTDAEGRVRFTFDRPGRWRLNAVAMTVAPTEKALGPNEPRYSSLWASLVVAVRAGPTPKASEQGSKEPSTPPSSGGETTK